MKAYESKFQDKNVLINEYIKLMKGSMTNKDVKDDENWNLLNILNLIRQIIRHLFYLFMLVLFILKTYQI